MTHLRQLDRFFRQLRGLRGNGWSVTDDGRIRDAAGRCPLNAVAVARGYVSRSVISFADPGRYIGLDERLCCKIADAADLPNADVLRARLLRAVGLELNGFVARAGSAVCGVCGWPRGAHR